MKHFLLKLLLFCFLPLPLLFFLDHAVEKGLSRSRYLYYSDWNDLDNGTINADLLILGTSRAYIDVSTKILDSAMHLNSYNLGMDGASFDIQYNTLKLYLRHNKKPKYIIQEVCYSTFAKSEPAQYLYEFISYLNDTGVRNFVKSNYPSLSWADVHFPLYKYNDNLPLVAEGLKSYIGRGAQDIKYKGYEARDNVWDSSFYLFQKKNPVGMTIVVDSMVTATFSDYLDFCTKNDIKVILFYAPTYFLYKPYILNYPAIHQMIVDQSVKHNTPFLDYMSDSMNYNKVYFYNSQHLNKRGAETFSVKLAADAGKIIDKPILRETPATY